MKTLHLTNAYHATSGGISTFYRALFAYANRQGRPMRLIVPAAESFTERIGEHGIIYHVQARNSPVADTRYRLLWALGSTGREIRAILRSEQPDLVEISDKYTLPLLSGFLRKNWISGVEMRPALVGSSHERMDHTTRAYFGFPLLWKAISRVFLKHYYFPMFDAHIANSAYTAEELIPASKGHRLHRDLRILPMGVDADSLTPEARTVEAQEALARRADVPRDAKMLLYVGRLSTEKNLMLLMDMTQLLPADYYLIVAGTGPLESRLRMENSNIRLIGHIQRASIPELYAGAGVFVHPNPREPFGIAPLEAMAAGLPLVAPNAGGILTYASLHNAWLAEPEPDAFASTVQAVFANQQERERKAHAARKIAEDHNWPNIAARYFQAFDEWIADRSRWMD